MYLHSGGKFDLGLDAESTDKKLSSDTIIISVPTKYKDLYSLNSRTLVIDSDAKQKAAYTALYALHHDIIKNLTVDNELRKVYKTASENFTQKAPDLVKFLPKEFGFGIG